MATFIPFNTKKPCKFYVKEKGRKWNLVPLSGRNRFSATLGNTIYLTPKRYADYTSDNPKSSTIALVEHEKRHVLQHAQEKNFKRKYLTNRHSRLRYEAEGYAMQVYVRELLGTSRSVDYYLNKYAKTMSSITYLLLASYETCRKAIQDEYENLKRRNAKIDGVN